MSENKGSSYDAVNFDGLERRGNYRFIAFREDILHALDKKEAAAIIFQIVYRWQAEYKRDEVLKKIDERKKSGQKPYTPEEIENMMFVYMSYNDFVRESGGALGYNTVIRTLKYLIEEKKVLIQRENHDPRFGDYEYSIDKDIARELLRSLPADPAFSPKVPKKKDSSTHLGTPTDDSTHLGTSAQRSTHLGTDSTHLGTEVYPFGSTSQEHTRTTQERGTYGDENVATTPALFSLSSSEVIHDGDNLSTKETATQRQAPAPTPKAKPRVTRPKSEPKPAKAEPVLSEKARAVWKVWLQMPWNKIEPDLTETAAKHCEKLSTVEMTVEIMLKIRNFAKKNDNNGFYEGKAWTLGNVVSEYPKWRSAEYKATEQESKPKEVLTIADLTKRSLSSLARL